MNRSLISIGWIALAVVMLTSPDNRSWAAERALRMSLGTLAPKNSVYHQSLMTMAEAWRQAPGGGVRLTIHTDGTQGGEADMVRLMRIGSLQAGLFTAVGLAAIEPAVSGLQDIPMLFQTLDEYDHVKEKLRPTLEKRMAEKGFVILFWADAGWVRFFSKEPVLTPDDMKRMKVFVWAGYPDQVALMRKAGYNPVPMETLEIPQALQTGMINMVATPPIFALTGQLNTRAPHMLDLNWAPLIGACIVKKDAWDKVPQEARSQVMAAATKAGIDMRARSRKESTEAVAAMKKRGLTVHEPTAEQVKTWREQAEKLYPDIRGKLIPAEVFDEVQRYVKEYRASGADK